MLWLCQPLNCSVQVSLPLPRGQGVHSALSMSWAEVMRYEMKARRTHLAGCERWVLWLLSPRALGCPSSRHSTLSCFMISTHPVSHSDWGGLVRSLLSQL